MEWRALADENGYRRLSIEAPWHEIAEDYQDLVTRYAATVPIPGFRPGKVPRSAVEQRCRAGIVTDLTSGVVQRLGKEAVREAGVEALGPIEATDVECHLGKPFRAVVSFLPMPEIVLPRLDDLGIEDDGTPARDRISRRLLDLVRFEVPGALVRRELAFDGLEDGAPGSGPWSAAAERIRLMTILRKIARQEGIEVDERDVNRRVAEKAAEFETTARVLETELARGGGEARLRDMLLAERTLEYLVELNRSQSGRNGG